MDKYNGINKAQSVSAPISYQVRDNKKPLPYKSGSERRFVFTALRYLVCVLLIGLCMLGKFTPLKPAQKASCYIKNELSRDTVKELAEIVEK